jgi:predicted aspartyl protease
MVAAREKKVGRFKVEIELANNDDMVTVRRGYLKPQEVRRQKIDGVVDSGAAYLVLPTAIAKKMGLAVTEKIKVRYANGSVARREKVEGVRLDLLGRHGLFSAILEPKRDTALIGAIVLEELDLLIDTKNGKLYPRDPESVLAEID